MDYTIKIKPNKTQARKLIRLAAERGLSPQEYVLKLLESALQSAVDPRRRRIKNPVRTKAEKATIKALEEFYSGKCRTGSAKEIVDGLMAEVEDEA